MRFTFLSIIILLSFTSITHGVGTARLHGASKSGRTVFDVELEDYDALNQAKLRIDNDSIVFSPDDRCVVTFDPDIKVFTINIESEANGNFDTVRYAQLWAIPASFERVSSAGTEFTDIYKFNAKMKARDPRANKEFETPLILLSCTLTYTGP